AAAQVVHVAAETAEDVVLTARRIVHGRHALRPRRQGEGDREAADVGDRRRRAVVGGREGLVLRRVGRRARQAVVGAAVAHVAQAHRTGLEAGHVRGDVAGEEDLRVERQAEARGAGGAVGRAAGVGRHRVDDADAGRRAARVRNRERRAEQAPDTRAIPVVGTRIGRLDAGQGQRRPAAGRHPGERAAHVGDGVGQRYAVAAAAGEEAAAGEVLQHDAGAALHRAAVAAPYTGGEV